jgi:hypothetical protein
MSTGAWGSQQQQGPDWYQASVGLWYPPQGGAAPAAPPQPQYQAPAPQPQPQYAAPPQQQYAAPQPQYAPAPGAYAQPSTAVQGWQPGMVQVSYNAPTEQVPKFKWIFAIFTCLGLFFNVLITGIIAGFSMYAAFFGILLQGRVHPVSHDKIVKFWRAQFRLLTYTMQWRNDVPAMPTTGAIDDGADKASLSAAYGGEGLNPFGPFIKFFTTLGDFVGVLIAGILAYVAFILGIIGIVTKGQFPEEQKAKVMDYMNKSVRYRYHRLLSDVKPPPA